MGFTVGFRVSGSGPRFHGLEVLACSGGCQGQEETHSLADEVRDKGGKLFGLKVSRFEAECSADLGNSWGMFLPWFRTSCSLQ